MKQAEAQANLVSRPESPLITDPIPKIIPFSGSCSEYAKLANQSGSGFAGVTSAEVVPSFMTSYSLLPPKTMSGFFCGCNSKLYKTYDECDRADACRPVIRCFASLCIPQNRSQICVEGTATGGFKVDVRITVHQWSVPDSAIPACTAEVTLFNTDVIKHEMAHVETYVDAVADWNRRHNNEKLSAEGCGSDVAAAQEDADRQIAEEIEAQRRALLTILDSQGEPPGGSEMNCSPCPD